MMKKIIRIQNSHQVNFVIIDFAGFTKLSDHDDHRDNPAMLMPP